MPPRIDDAFNPNRVPSGIRELDPAIVSGIADEANPDKVGVYGHGRNKAGVWAYGDRFGLVAQGAELAAEFFGHARVRGDVTCDGNLTATDIFLANADVAEDFDIAAGAGAEPGTVMVLTAGGALRPSDRAYDRKVAGVISGAGAYRPGVVLDRRPADPGRAAGARMPIALFGKVYCKADASAGPIEAGDLLTTSWTVGHAMRAADPGRTAGAIVGKALDGLRYGLGLVPVLVALQ